MKRFALSCVALACVAILLFSFSACVIIDDGGGADSVKNIGMAASATRLSHQERQNDDFKTVVNSAERFANALSPSLYATQLTKDNFVVSPISVYMALALASECATGATRDEILSAFGLSYESLQNGFSYLYRSLWSESTDYYGKLASQLKFTNSIWVDSNVSVKDKCIQTLADKYYCYSYSADFANDNSGANKAIRQFVSDKTNKLIDKDFNLPNETVFSIINTLYLKDVWNEFGSDLPFANDNYKFTSYSGQTKSVNMLQGYYTPGNVYQTESFTHYYTETYNGYTLKFIVPNDGYSVDDVFNAETLELVNGIDDYHACDHVNYVHYNTRCIFPEFSASFDDYLNGVLQSVFGINALFDSEACSFATLTDTGAYCSKIEHVAKLNVDKKGIEGAAVTIEIMCGSAGPDECELVYQDFVVDRAFGFILTDRQGTTLFSGVIGNV